MDIQQALSKVVDRIDLSTDEMQSVMTQVMTGEATQAQIGALLMGLRMKGETIEEITGAAKVMRQLASGVQVAGDHVVDTCGTGGDGANLFNVSTASAFVVAAAGGKVAKHGNRSVSSKTGSADLLEAAGVNLQLTPEQVGRAIEEIGVGFMFAPAHHGAMKHAIGPRKEMAMRTIFNMLGPLTNPAGVKNQVIGVFSKALCRPLAEVLKNLGSEHVLVVHSDDGLDEISIASKTYVAELNKGEISEYEITPEECGIESQTLLGLSVESAQQSLDLINDALGKRETEAGQKAADIIAINAGAAIYAANLSTTLNGGIEMAQDAIYSGLAKEKMTELVSFSAALAE
jgi:anthranilate phosphoribosyltransferase